MASNFVAIEFDKQDFRVAASQLQGKHVRVRAAFQVDHSEDDTDEQIGLKLKAALNQHGFPRGDAIIVINRADVEIREITVPPAPDNELPALVRFKAKTEFATATDNWTIDFVPLSGTATTERDLLATALPANVTERLTTIAESAGLKVRHIVLRPLATIDLVSGDVGNQFCLVVAPNGEAVDLSLVNNGQMILTRSVRSNAQGDLDRLFQQLTLEVHRTLSSAAKRIGTKRLDKIVILGEKKRYQPLGDALEEKLEAKTGYITPFSQISLKGEEPDSPERYASLVGSLITQGLNRKHQIDFLNPRKPIAERGKHGNKFLIAGVAVAALLVVVFFGWRSLRNQSLEISELKEQLLEIKNENDGRGDGKGVEQIIGEVEKVDHWLASAPNWLDELEQISQRTMDSDSVIIDKFFGNIGNESPVAVIKGRMKAHNTNTDLQMQLAVRPYTVVGKGTRPAKTRDYPVSMEQNLKIKIDLKKTQQEINERAEVGIESMDAMDVATQESVQE